MENDQIQQHFFIGIVHLRGKNILIKCRRRNFLKGEMKW